MNKITARSIIALLIVVIAAIAFAADIIWRPTNQATIAWDPVTTFLDNTELPPGTTVQYKVYYRLEGSLPGAPPTEAATTSATQATITFTDEGRYFIGIKAQRLFNGTLIPESDSTIAWSDTAAATQAATPFGVVYFKVLKATGGLR